MSVSTLTLTPGLNFPFLFLDPGPVLREGMEAALLRLSWLPAMKTLQAYPGTSSSQSAAWAQAGYSTPAGAQLPIGVQLRELHLPQGAQLVSAFPAFVFILSLACALFQSNH